MPEPVAMTVEQFRLAIAEGAILPGDCVGVAYGRPTAMQRVIERVQRRLLVDLVGTEWATADDADERRWEREEEGESMREWAAEYGRYTHSRLVLSAAEAAEMTSPAARIAPWEQLLRPGDVLAVTRPREGRQWQLALAAGWMGEWCRSRPPYPYRELLGYYLWSWGLQKLAMGRRFERVFASRTRDVCSGTIWRAWRFAGAIVDVSGLDHRPEAWYPARLALPGRHVRTVATVRIRSTEHTENTERTADMGRMGRMANAAVGVLALLALLAAPVVLTGCAVGVAGARVSLATPFSKPNFSYDSVGVAQKNDRAAGATFTDAGGTAARADADTLTGSADQIVQVGGDASNARSTDSSLADDQSQAQGRQGGDQTDSGTKTLDQTRTPTLNIGPAGGAQLGIDAGSIPPATTPGAQ